MKKSMRKIAGIISLVMVLFSCNMLTGPNSGGEGNGSKPGPLTITINEQVSRAILPEISMDPDGYEVQGTGPGGAVFSQSTAGTSISVGDLAFWSVDNNGNG